MPTTWTPGDEAKLKRVAGEHQMTWRQLVATAGRVRDVAGLYSVAAAPRPS